MSRSTPLESSRRTCLISGWITLVSSGTLRQYNVVLEAVDPDQGNKVWMMNKAIKKMVVKP